MQPIYYVPQRKSGVGCACCALTLVIMAFVTMVVCLSHMDFAEIHQRITGRHMKMGKMEFSAEYDQFLQEHNKHYLTKEEKKMRYQVWEQNYRRLLEAVDSGVYEHELGMYSYHDLTKEEFKNFLGLAPYTPRAHRTFRSIPKASTDVDWVALGKVAAVKDQGQCGSCWAFSAIGSVETLHAIQSGVLTQYSEQELVDCSGTFGNDGCDGGWMDNGFDYIIENGISTEGDYPYTAKDQKCMDTSSFQKYTIGGYVDVPENDNGKLYDALNVNSVSVAVDAEDNAFYFYKGGIITKCGTDLDHGVLLVASGVESSTPFLRIKNSWSASWGESGFVRFKRLTTKGPGVCGVAMAASYPTA